MDGWMYTAVVSRSNDNGDLGRGSRLSRVLFGAKGKEGGPPSRAAGGRCLCVRRVRLCPSQLVTMKTQDNTPPPPGTKFQSFE